MNNLRSIPFKCLNHECEETPTYEEYEKHLSTCQKGKTECNDHRCQQRIEEIKKKADALRSKDKEVIKELKEKINSY